MFISFFYSFLKKNLFLTFRFYFLTKIFPDSLFINDILFSKYPTTINFLLFVQNIFIFFYLHFVKKFLSRYRYFIRKKKERRTKLFQSWNSWFIVSRVRNVGRTALFPGSLSLWDTIVVSSSIIHRSLEKSHP